MSKINIDILSKGFPGQTNRCKLAWSTVLLVRTEDHNIIVDTGSYAARKYILPSLRKLNLDPSDIDTVLLTHLHHDHVAGVDLFPQALIVFSEVEWAWANTTNDLALQVANLSLLHAYRRKLITTDGEKIFDGINAVFTPGHTPGSLSYVISINGEKWVASGDAIRNRSDLTVEDIEFGVSEADVCRETVKKIRRTADYILPGHDCLLKIEENNVYVMDDNEVILILPPGITINGQSKVSLRLDR
jgi:glyoxylase-like metal-dependent hydrolase (beta-lactamase superfamily II)